MSLHSKIIWLESQVLRHSVRSSSLQKQGDVPGLSSQVTNLCEMKIQKMKTLKGFTFNFSTSISIPGTILLTSLQSTFPDLRRKFRSSSSSKLLSFYLFDVLLLFLRDSSNTWIKNVHKVLSIIYCLLVRSSFLRQILCSENISQISKQFLSSSYPIPEELIYHVFLWEIC